MLRRVAPGPLAPLIQSRRGSIVPLPPNLARLYGDMYLPPVRSKVSVLSNFVTTLDGVVSLHAKGHQAGADISGFNIDDRMVMGLLRAVADVVIVGSGTLAADPQHIWTPEAICPELKEDYSRLRAALRRRSPPLNVVVSGNGKLDLRLPVFESGQVQTMILTSSGGAARLARQRVPHGVEIRAIHRDAGPISARAILNALARIDPSMRILVEGGPTLLGYFFAERLIDELFLTLAPQIAGRKHDDGRPSLVMDQHFAPRDPLWGQLSDLRRGASHLFLRYTFTKAARGAHGPIRPPKPARRSRTNATGHRARRSARQ